MAGVMIDSSVWIEYFRKGSGTISDQVDSLLDRDQAVLCGMIELEILQGMRPQEQKQITSLFSAIPYIETGRIDFQSTGEYMGRLRAKGITIPSSDCLIAVLCMRHGLHLFSTDRHFDVVKELKRHPIA